MSLKFQVIGPPLLSGVFTEAARFAAPCDAAPRFGRATFALLVFAGFFAPFFLPAFIPLSMLGRRANL